MASFDYSKLTDKELTELREQTARNIVRFNNLQMAKKISLNSAYGALS